MYPRQIHQKLFDDQDGKCFYCKEPMLLVRPEISPLRACTLDHKVARACGGGSCESNLVAACAQCNSIKGHLHINIFLNLMQRASDKRHLASLCITAMYPNCRIAKRGTLGRNFSTKKESQLERAWENILAARAAKLSSQQIFEVGWDAIKKGQDHHAAVAQMVEARA